MQTKNEIENSIHKFIVDNFLFRDGGESLSDTASLLERGLIDSTGVLELVFFLEKTFAIKVPDEEVLPENLDSVRQLTAYVQRKLEAKRSASAA